jgi:hypothetical protein
MRPIPRMRLAQRLALLPLLGLVVVLASCSASAPPTGPSVSPKVSPSSTAVPTTPPAGSLKPMIQGLVDRFGPPPGSFLGIVTNFVVNAEWSELQPTAGGALTPDNVIDQAIAAARSLEATVGAGRVGVKIRLLAGIYAPGWAKQLGGAPVAVVDPQTGVAGTIGRFWTSAFGMAYDDLYAKLAAAYDGVPEIREVTVARCMTVYDEPFIRDVGDSATVQNLLAAGFSVAEDQQCQEQEIQDGTLWHHTRIGVAFNPYQAIAADGTTRTDEAFTEQMMDYCRSILGPQCVLENDSIRDPPLGGAYATMYSAIQQLGPPISFQTATLQRVGDLQGTLSWAAGLGADAVELPQQYHEMPASSLQQPAALLEQNPA